MVLVFMGISVQLGNPGLRGAPLFPWYKFNATNIEKDTFCVKGVLHPLPQN